jgi:hypothetical protein
MKKTIFVATMSLGLVAVIASGCGDDSSQLNTSSSSSAASASSSATSTTTSTSSSSGVGGAGGAGGGGVTCLSSSVATDVLAVIDPDLCIVASYDADTGIDFAAPTWGRNGGPLFARSGATAGAVDIERWTAPASAMGSLTKEPLVTVDAMIPMGAFLGGQALDLPAFNWTALTWSGAFPNTQGELIATDKANVAARYAVNSAYSMAGLKDAMGMRVVYTGLSSLGDAAASVNGLYAADTCAMGMSLSGDASCTPQLVDAWGDASGPIAADADGNVIAFTTSFDGTQEARGYAAKSIARGAAATKGETLVKMPGFGSSLAAIAPTAAAPGIVLFQPSDATTFDALDVIAIRYENVGGTLAAKGMSATALTLATKKTPLAIFGDGQGRIWVGATVGKKARFVVVARAK